jgi:2-polyprenyl-6-methoxyphenol hydroxylase-like FAD-dependent oxidoreductase
MEGPDSWWPTPEPPHRVNQIYLEPLLMAHAASLPQVRILHRCRLEDFSQTDSGAVATIRDLDADDTFPVGCAYLIGCDGGRSAVRKKIGAKLIGTPVVRRVQSTYIRAPELLSRIPDEPAWLYHVRNPRRCGSMFAIDGRETWIVHIDLDDNETSYDSVDRDWAIRTILGVGADFRYETISKEDWVGRRLIADRFRERRVFICGDAAHVWIPFAGYGMNAGIADAMNLSWLIAATRWASPAILDAYAAERRPVTEQVSRYAMDLALNNIEQRCRTPAAIEMPGPEGDAARACTGREALELNIQQFCCGGLNFGYFCDASPIIAYDGAVHPPFTMYDFTPSSVPGCRAPHFWLTDGRSLYDALGPEFTLLRFDRSVSISGLVDTAARRRVPLAVLDIEATEARSLYARNLVLVRPDQHVAWRGNGEPATCIDLIDRLRGALATTKARKVA